MKAKFKKVTKKTFIRRDLQTKSIEKLLSEKIECRCSNCAFKKYEDRGDPYNRCPEYRSNPDDVACDGWEWSK